LGEAPVDVYHLNFVGKDRRGDGQSRAPRAIVGAAMIKVDSQYAFHAGKRLVFEDFSRDYVAAVVQQRAPCICGTDVGDQVHIWGPYALRGY
jgi:hypothetical protein